MFRFRSNWRTILVEPSWLVDVIWLIPAMRPNWRSSGVATAEAMVSGLAPGRPAETETTGNSTCGSGATGRKLNARIPAISNAAASSEVPTGRLMNGAEIFMLVAGGWLLDGIADLEAGKFPGQAVEPQIDHGSGVQGKQLANQ